jgi:hypothetical protein
MVRLRYCHPCHGRCRSWRDLGPNTQRSLSARLFPAELLHNHPNYYTHRLSQPFGAMGMLGGEERVDARPRFKLSYDPGQWGSIVMNLRLLHAALAARVVEKGKDFVKRLPQVVDYVGKGPALAIGNEALPGDNHSRHVGFHQI